MLQIHELLVSNELDFPVKLRLFRHDVLLNTHFAVRLGAQTKTLHTPAAFVHDEQQIFTATKRLSFHGTASVDMKKLEWIVVALAGIAWKWSLNHFSFLTVTTNT